MQLTTASHLTDGSSFFAGVGHPRRVRLDAESLRQACDRAGYTLLAIEQHVGVSPRQVRRLFRSQLGTSPEKWLREQKLQQGRLMLLGTASIKQVAFALGYAHLSQFSRDFRLQFGCSPSAWVAADSASATGSVWGLLRPSRAHAP